LKSCTKISQTVSCDTTEGRWRRWHQWWGEPQPQPQQRCRSFWYRLQYRYKPVT